MSSKLTMVYAQALHTEGRLSLLITSYQSGNPSFFVCPGRGGIFFGKDS